MGVTYMAMGVETGPETIGSLHQEPELTHAVEMVDGVLKHETICGVQVSDEIVREFDTTMVRTRCPLCASKVGFAHL